MAKGASETVALDEAMASGWRELGVFYDSDDERKAWRLAGSREGLGRFVTALRSYTERPSSRQIGEHEHFGPHMYLTFITWDSAGVDDRAIRGSVPQLERLADKIAEVAAVSQPGDRVNLTSWYAPGSEYGLWIEVMADDFDPASLDK